MSDVIALLVYPACRTEPFPFWYNIQLETTHMEPLNSTSLIITANKLAALYIGLAVTPRTFLVIIILYHFFITIGLGLKLGWSRIPLCKQLR